MKKYHYLTLLISLSSFFVRGQQTSFSLEDFNFLELQRMFVQDDQEFLLFEGFRGGYLLNDKDGFIEGSQREGVLVRSYVIVPLTKSFETRTPEIYNIKMQDNPYRIVYKDAKPLFIEKDDIFSSDNLDKTLDEFYSLYPSAKESQNSRVKKKNVSISSSFGGKGLTRPGPPYKFSWTESMPDADGLFIESKKWEKVIEIENNADDKEYWSPEKSYADNSSKMMIAVMQYIVKKDKSRVWEFTFNKKLLLLDQQGEVLAAKDFSFNKPQQIVEMGAVQDLNEKLNNSMYVHFKELFGMGYKKVNPEPNKYAHKLIIMHKDGAVDELDFQATARDGKIIDIVKSNDQLIMNFMNYGNRKDDGDTSDGLQKYVVANGVVEKGSFIDKEKFNEFFFLLKNGKIGQLGTYISDFSLTDDLLVSVFQNKKMLTSGESGTSFNQVNLVYRKKEDGSFVKIIGIGIPEKTILEKASEVELVELSNGKFVLFLIHAQNDGNNILQTYLLDNDLLTLTPITSSNKNMIINYSQIHPLNNNKWILAGFEASDPSKVIVEQKSIE